MSWQLVVSYPTENSTDFYNAPHGPLKSLEQLEPCRTYSNSLDCQRNQSLTMLRLLFRF